MHVVYQRKNRDMIWWWFVVSLSPSVSLNFRPTMLEALVIFADVWVLSPVLSHDYQSALSTVCSLMNTASCTASTRRLKAENRTRLFSARPEGGSRGRSLPALHHLPQEHAIPSEGFQKLMIWSQLSASLRVRGGIWFAMAVLGSEGSLFSAWDISELYFVCHDTLHLQLHPWRLWDFQDDWFATWLVSKWLLRKAGTSCRWHKSLSVCQSL